MDTYNGYKDYNFVRLLKELGSRTDRHLIDPSRNVTTVRHPAFQRVSCPCHNVCACLINFDPHLNVAKNRTGANRQRRSGIHFKKAALRNNR